VHTLTYGRAGRHDPRCSASGAARRYSGFKPIGFRSGLSGSSGSTPQPAPQVARCVPMFEGMRLTTDIAAQDTRASASVVEQRLSMAHPCLAATVSAIRISSDPPEDHDEDSKRHLESPHVCTTPGDGLCTLTTSRTPATRDYRWFCGLRAGQTPCRGTWGLCRLHGRSAPGWGGRNRCNAVALRWWREAAKSSTGTLLRDAHGKVPTVEVGTIERGDRGVGAFLRLHLDEAETS